MFQTNVLEEINTHIIFGNFLLIMPFMR